MKKLICFMILLLQICCFSTNVYAETLSSVLGKTCIIRSAINNNYVIDAYFGIRNELRENIQLYHYHGGDNQQFVISRVDNVWYKIINVKTNKAIDVAGGIAGDEVNVQLWEQNGTDAQLFRFEDAGNGYYFIKNKLGYYLDVYWGGVYWLKCQDEQNIQTCRKNGGNNQKWLLTSIRGTNQEILNASWEVDLSKKISWTKVGLNSNTFNMSGYQSPYTGMYVPTPGRKYLARIDYIDASTVSAILEMNSIIPSKKEKIKKLLFGDIKNNMINKAGGELLKSIGFAKDPQVISTIVGVLEILSENDTNNGNWNNVVRKIFEGYRNNISYGIIKYTYVNFSKNTVWGPLNNGTTAWGNNYHIISYKTYEYETWNGINLSTVSGYTGEWTYRYK